MVRALTASVVDSHTKQSFEATYERFPVRIGRNQLNDLHIDRPYVSQFHANIEVTDAGRLIIKDLGSTNGTVYRGTKLQRDQPVDVTDAPEFNIGPVLIRMQTRELKDRETVMPQQEASVLDIFTPAGASLLERRSHRIPPGQEDPFIQQLVPYVEAYRSAWANVYRLIYEHLTRLQPNVRNSYLKRLLIEHSCISHEADFQKVAQYYGVPVYSMGELVPSTAALAALNELSRTLLGEQAPLDDVPKMLSFARRVRDIMEVFLKCFVSLRDGHQEFEVEVLKQERLDAQGNNTVGSAKDHKELGLVLFSDTAGPDNARHLNDIFVEVMMHQVALINGVMEGAKQLLESLSPTTIEKHYERKGKKGGLFSNKYEGLWQEYQRVHGDYQGEDKETFRTIFGQKFHRAYAATAGEAYQASGDGANRATANQTRR